MEAWDYYDFAPNAPKYGSPMFRCGWCEEDILQGETYYTIEDCNICGGCLDSIKNSGRVAGEE
jgi:hypothetical protein